MVSGSWKISSTRAGRMLTQIGTSILKIMINQWSLGYSFFRQYPYNVIYIYITFSLDSPIISVDSSHLSTICRIPESLQSISRESRATNYSHHECLQYGITWIRDYKLRWQLRKSNFRIFLWHKLSTESWNRTAYRFLDPALKHYPQARCAARGLSCDQPALRVYLGFV